MFVRHIFKCYQPVTFGMYSFFHFLQFFSFSDGYLSVIHPGF
jgi:hypothetical protein